MLLGIIGRGVVGGAIAKAFSQRITVRTNDVLPDRSTHSLLDTLRADVVMICLPTPQGAGGSSDTRVIESFLQALSWMPEGRDANLVLRSTVPIGFTEWARKTFSLPRLIHYPEFLSRATAEEDALYPTRHVIGAASDCQSVRDCHDALVAILREACIANCENPQAMYHVTSDESEAVKLFQNVFSAIKISAFNEFYAVAKAAKMDWKIVLAALLAGGWINERHTQVPGPDGKLGFGGDCLPKDLANYAHSACTKGVNPLMALGALTTNRVIRDIPDTVEKLAAEHGFLGHMDESNEEAKNEAEEKLLAAKAKKEAEGKKPE